MTKHRETEPIVLSAELLVTAYKRGYFPMYDPEYGIQWHWPQQRAIFPLDKVVPGKRMRKILADPSWVITRDSVFLKVMNACADRETTWLNNEMIGAYHDLHEKGYAHSVEVWQQNELVGGLYGVAIGGAFFGESMFNRSDNAAKVAFHHLVTHLKERGFQLLDSQYLNDFTHSLGAVEVPREEFEVRLNEALVPDITW